MKFNLCIFLFIDLFLTYFNNYGILFGTFFGGIEMKEKICDYINNVLKFDDNCYEHLVTLYGIKEVNEIILEVLRNKEIDTDTYEKIVKCCIDSSYKVANNLFIIRACELVEEINDIFISLGYTDKKFINEWMDEKVNIISNQCNDSDILFRISQLYKEFIFFRNIVCNCNLNLIKYVISGVMDKNTFDELYQEGFIGLMKAIEKFDYKGGIKFSTCAVNYISYAVREHNHDYDFSVSIPRIKVSTYYRIVKMQEEARDILGRELTLEELAEKMSIRVSTLLNYLDFNNFLTTYMQIDGNKTSEVFGENFRTVENDVFDDNLESLMSEFLERFNDRQKLILKYRFYGKEIRTFDEVGKLMGVSKQYVNADYNRILKRMRRIGKELKRYY